MKSKSVDRPEPELDQDDDDIEVEDSGPEIAAGKKSKVTVVAASVLLTVFVVYFFFIKESGPKEQLEAIKPPRPSAIAPSETGKSPFELDAPADEESKADVDILAQPTTPELPTLPELPEDAISPDKLSLKEEKVKTEEIQQQLPGQEQAQQKNKLGPQIESGQDDVYVEQDLGYQKTDPRYAPILVFSGAVNGSVPPRGVGYDDNIRSLKKDPIEALQETTTSITATRIADMTHTIAQGKLLTAVLETAINTELPGSVRAVVSRDVYGEAGNDVLIPRGSRLFGAYSSTITRGQGRVEIGWTRIIRPDGVDMSISFNASDRFGRSGLPGTVDNKYASLIANSMMTSMLAVGGVAAAQAILGDDTITTATTNAAQGTTTTTGSAVNQSIYDVTKTVIDTVGQVVSNNIDLSPVIRVPQGTRITVIVNSDITVPSARE